MKVKSEYKQSGIMALKCKSPMNDFGLSIDSDWSSSGWF